jgi:hypothetical protein
MLSSAFASYSDVFKALQYKHLSKSVGDDVIPGFAIRNCSDISVPVPKHNSDLSLPQ